MSSVLYEVSTGYGNIVMPMAVPVIIFLLWVAIFRLKNGTGSGTAGSKRRLRYVHGFIGGMFLLVSSYLILQGKLDMYRKVVIPYVNGQYEVVEGYVHNFVPMPREGHANEEFDIQDVHFEYSDNNIITGYNRARVNGGVVRGNGQYLKIGYVYYNETYGSIIVYIEEMTP